MAQTIIIKLRTAGPRVGPFTIKDNLGNIVATDVSRQDLKVGIPYSVDDAATVLTITSTGKVVLVKDFTIAAYPSITFQEVSFTATKKAVPVSYPPIDEEEQKACVWKHLKNPIIYNTFYGITEPYILEYPFSYKFQDQILQNVRDYTKVFRYVNTGDGISSDFAKYETDDEWFNKAIVYNGQQNSGILNLVSKPKNDLKTYMSYPILNTDSKDILFSKNDNFYQYNTFWSIIKESGSSTSLSLAPLTQFIRTCENLSIDKEINQAFMDYSKRSHKKHTMRAKDLKIRHILDNRSNVKLVSQFIFTPTQISYK